MLSVLRLTEEWLHKRGIDAPKRSAELLLGKVLGMDRLQLYLAHDRPLSTAERDAMRELVARRGHGVPVAYLLGSWSFRGHELEVTPAVLIPRPETEELVELALAGLPSGARVLDLGTGSGAIAIGLALARPDLQVLATDVSPEALAVAQRNVARHRLGERVRLAAGSWYEACAAEPPFDLVVSNPPYVDAARTDLIAAEVAAHEPALALYAATGDVVSSYRAIAAGLARHLRPAGRCVLETGIEAADAARELLMATPALQQVELRRDAAGLPRFLLGIRAAATAPADRG